MHDLRIRKFNPSDLERILEIENSSFTIDAFSEATFKSWYNKCADLFIVAELDEDIAGYMITHTLPDKGDVISMAVDVPYRRKGIGRALARFTFQKLKERRLTTVQLEARTANSAAVGFWKSLGFLSVGTIPAFYRDGGEALRMRRTETNASQASDYTYKFNAENGDPD